VAVTYVTAPEDKNNNETNLLRFGIKINPTTKAIFFKRKV
jgi:hypothetical protein